MKHDLKSYCKTLIAIFENENKIDRTELINKIATSRNIAPLEAVDILKYCLSKKLVKSEHYYSFYYKYTLNKTVVRDFGGYL